MYSKFLISIDYYSLSYLFLSSPITPKKHNIRYKGSIPRMALMITPFQVGLFLAPLIIAFITNTIKAIKTIVKRSDNAPYTRSSIVSLVKIIIHPAVEQGFSLLDRLGNQFFLFFNYFNLGCEVLLNV